MVELAVVDLFSFCCIFTGKKVCHTSTTGLPQKRSTTQLLKRSAIPLPHLCHRKVYHNVCHNVYHTGFSVIWGFSGQIFTKLCHNFVVLISELHSCRKNYEELYDLIMPESVKLHQEDWCYIHNKNCVRIPCGDKEGQLCLKVSGTPCPDWSNFGKHGRDGGPTAPATIVETLGLHVGHI